MFPALSCPSTFLHTQGFTQYIGIDFCHVIFRLWSKLYISVLCEKNGVFYTLKIFIFLCQMEKKTKPQTNKKPKKPPQKPHNTLQMGMWKITAVVFQSFSAVQS